MKPTGSAWWCSWTLSTARMNEAQRLGMVTLTDTTHSEIAGDETRLCLKHVLFTESTETIPTEKHFSCSWEAQMDGVHLPGFMGSIIRWCPRIWSCSCACGFIKLSKACRVNP
eukprot:1157718-Pelagomonas_calceolata.AAC.11